MRSTVSFVLTIGLALSTLGCDQSIKMFALETLSQAPINLPLGVELTYTENRDMAFGLLSAFLGETTRLWLLSAIKGMAVVGALVFLFMRRESASKGELVGVALVLSGAAGNLIDRIRLGYVVDFLRLPYWPVFNVADMALVVGLGLIVLSVHRREAALAHLGSREAQ